MTKASFSLPSLPARARPAVSKARVPRIVRLLAFAHRIDASLRAGQIESLAQAASRRGLTRARLTQILDFTLLAPTIQEAILSMPPVQRGRDPNTERQLRQLLRVTLWADQLRQWKRRGTSTPAS